MHESGMVALRAAVFCWGALWIAPLAAHPPRTESPLTVASIGYQLDHPGVRHVATVDGQMEASERLPPRLSTADARPVVEPPLTVDEALAAEGEVLVPPPDVSQPKLDAAATTEWLVEQAAVPPIPEQPMVGFELHRDAATWLVGNGDDFGFYSLEGVSTLNLGRLEGTFSGYAVHFVGGPIQTDMPPRLFELFVGYRAIGDLSARWGYDVTVSPGIYTDFEGHAHQGWRIRGLGLATYRWSAATTVVLGVACLDRENLDVLPVGGLVIQPNSFTRWELVFPEPRVSTTVHLGNQERPSRLYLRGQLGGGSWAIERDSDAADIATYQDLRAFVGISSEDEDGQSTFMEIGYVFDRRLEYRSGIGDMPFDDTIMFRSGVRY